MIKGACRGSQPMVIKRGKRQTMIKVNGRGKTSSKLKLAPNLVSNDLSAGNLQTQQQEVLNKMEKRGLQLSLQM